MRRHWPVVVLCGLVAVSLIAVLISELTRPPKVDRAATPTGPARCTQAEARIVSEHLTPLIGQWRDQFQIAQNAPRVSLPDVLTQMQDTRRQYAAAPYPACYAAAHAGYLASMDDTIAGFTAFMGQQDDVTVQADFERANQELAAANVAADAAKP